MKIWVYGDSFVAGDQDIPGRIDAIEEYTEYNRYNVSFASHLANALNVKLINRGISGCSNFVQLDKLFLDAPFIKKDDIVVVMWSSSLRDNVPFFPSNNPWHFWGETSIRKKHIYGFILDKAHFAKSDNQSSLKKEYKQYFIDNLFSETYYDIINQNYILYIQ